MPSATIISSFVPLFVLSQNRGMRWILPLLVASIASGAGTYELAGELQPRAFAVVSIFGVSFPYVARTFTELDGKFKFKKLAPGTYQLSLNSRRRGEARKTVEVGPSSADSKHRVKLALPLAQLNWERPAEGRLLVNIRELTVSEKAR